ncbi:AraC family transcriptional regulator [Paenibacillus sp. Marseille-P2973]|uniref:helix-turn-helix domain-containing protein n=1 Tax=Paenibacillus sp. Marseille-P2973 TaxID=1871032 RepID=UPI001B37376B|nr:AraC family transcriptional regulator [Paenibacillus sp. Marseille-P2973]MBQ4899139.1 AraC family transcriptional regulator [Paenibacillus sp. Marseille-P2973]
MNISEEHHIAEFMLPDMDSTFRIFAAHLRTVTQDWSYPRHTHPLFEVNLLLSGRQEMIVNGQRFVQEPGDLMLLRPEDVHESRAASSERMTYYCLHFNVDDRVLREMLCQGGRFHFEENSPLVKTIRPSLDKLIQLTSGEGTVKLSNRMRALSAVFELFAGLGETLVEQNRVETPNGRMARIAAEIAAGLEKSVEAPESEWLADADAEGEEPSDLSRETVAAVTEGLGYSASSCNRMFHRVYGMSPRQYLSALKLKKAKLLLMESALSVEAVSARLGYKDIAHFSRQFKRWTGEPPGKFRARFHI